MADKVHSFTDLVAWREAHKLVLAVYRATSNFPKFEQFGLSDQVRRAAVSVTSNIAEGFSRSTRKDKVQFLTIARGSLTEVQSQLIIAKELGYIDKKTFDDLANQSVRVHKLINGLIRTAESRVAE